MDDLLYCYPGSDVLKNKLEIRDQEKLREIERKCAAGKGKAALGMQQSFGCMDAA